MIDIRAYPGRESVGRIRHRIDGDNRNTGFGSQNARQPSSHRRPNQKIRIHLHQLSQALFDNVFRALGVIDVVTIDRTNPGERFEFVAVDIEAAGEAMEVVDFWHILH